MSDPHLNLVSVLGPNEELLSSEELEMHPPQIAQGYYFLSPLIPNHMNVFVFKLSPNAFKLKVYNYVTMILHHLSKFNSYPLHFERKIEKCKKISTLLLICHSTSIKVIPHFLHENKRTDVLSHQALNGSNQDSTNVWMLPASPSHIKPIYSVNTKSLSVLYRKCRVVTWKKHGLNELKKMGLNPTTRLYQPFLLENHSVFTYWLGYIAE